ncbi:unnamed protein product [Prorocentrum cordatum]|uniref:PH domain-containing protein n=1 Tax=Prorocentrum cordatum TaxID=2364126 RepID=A0ABN9TEQ2_9DINO|nr:unnamed protein product [Polarella glacialis]
MAGRAPGAPPRPLLKFRGGAPSLEREGLELVGRLRAPLRVAVFVGDGRSGKSHLASEALLGLDHADQAAFVSGSSAKPVTQGIDVAAVDHDGGHLLILDCEGGNNALGEIRALVNVIGTLLGTLVVFVTGGAVSEGALQNLGVSLAARELVRRDASCPLHEQGLLVVVNLTRLEYSSSHLEEMLAERPGDAGRSDLRRAIGAAFPRRGLLAVPAAGQAGYGEALGQLRRGALGGAAPLAVGGAPVDGRQARGLLERAFSEVTSTQQVDLPSMHRYVLFHGFLSPLVERLGGEFRSSLPELAGYQAQLELRDPSGPALEAFDRECRGLTHKQAVAEARAQLAGRLTELWASVLLRNEALGMEVCSATVETRAVPVLTRVEQLGCGASAVSVSVTTSKVQSRVRTVRRRSPEPEYSSWKDTGQETERIETGLPRTIASSQVVSDALPADLHGHLRKRTRPLVRSQGLCTGGIACNGTERGLTRSHRRFFVLTRMHLLWWKTKASFERGEPSASCINLLVHEARLEFDDAGQSFSVYPRHGFWAPPHTFEGGAERVFHFDCRGSEHSADRWQQLLQAHVAHAQRVAGTLGKRWIQDNVRVERFSLAPGCAPLDPSAAE